MLGVMSDIDSELKAALEESEAPSQDRTLQDRTLQDHSKNTEPSEGTGSSSGPAGEDVGGERGAAQSRRVGESAQALQSDGEGLVSDRQRTNQEAPKRSIGLLIALLVMGGGILTLVLTSVDEAAVYSVTTDQLMQDKERFAGRNLRVEGQLVKGSLRHRAEPCEYRFSVEKGGEKLPVRYAACIVPDTFRDVPDMDVQVTAEGKLTEEGYFEATHIMAKCPSKYEMRKRQAQGESAPHAVMGAPPEAAPIAD